MTLGLVVRSIIVLVLGVAVAALALTRAAVPPRSAVANAVSGTGGVGPIIVMATPSAPPTALPAGMATPTPRPTATPVVSRPNGAIALFHRVRGHIFFDDTHNDIEYITGQYPKWRISGNQSSVAPALSPDGTRLAWVNVGPSYSDIWVTGLGYKRGNGMVLKATTRVTYDDFPPPDLEVQPVPPPGTYDPRYRWWAFKPNWLPGGQHLVYISDRPGFDVNNPENATGAIWEQGVSDPITNAVQLTTPVAGTGGDDSPMWRPHDPALFIYVNYPTDNSGVVEAALVTTSTVPGTAPTVSISDLTPSTVNAELPAWSPDSHDIAFVEDDGHNTTTLRVMPFHRPGSIVDYAKAVTVVTGHPYVTQPFWSPDGRYLGYLASTGGDFHMYIVRVTRHKGTLRFGHPIALIQAGAVSASWRPTWGPR